MSDITKLEIRVRELYEANNRECADWADWLYKNHVFVVADYAEKLAERFGADPNLSRAAAMLHDCADAVMSRFDPRHEEETMRLSRDLLEEAGYTPDEIKIVVDDAIRYHSCHDGVIPETLEGKVLATADALAHLQTDFYDFAKDALGAEKSPEEIRNYILKKSDRDFNQKICFDEVRTEAKADFDRVQTSLN